MTCHAIPFEGPEKKIELILKNSRMDLRLENAEKWEHVVKASGSNILSKISSPSLDAYLLSESSLFVWDDRILMITCGQTTLLPVVPAILSFLPRSHVGYFFYERKNLMYPTNQPPNFEDDVAQLAHFFPGKSYRLGPVNHDHVHVFYSSMANKQSTQDTTLELLMHDLSVETLNTYSHKSGYGKTEALGASGIDRLFDNMIIDAHLFSPTGFSVNGIAEDKYFTVHVSPQSGGSYASFETNVSDCDVLSLIKQVLSLFAPGRFTLVYTRNSNRNNDLPSFYLPEIPGYSNLERSVYEFDSDYAITFGNYGR